MKLETFINLNQKVEVKHIYYSSRASSILIYTLSILI